MKRDWSFEVKRLHGCKNPEECGATTNIADVIECGWGKLDDMGFWEHFCAPCTRGLTKALLEDQQRQDQYRQTEFFRSG